MERLSATELREKIAAGSMSSVDATTEVFGRIDKHESAIGAFISTFREQALKRAADIDRRIAASEPLGPLAGVPVVVKDNMCTNFGATTCASRILQNFHSYDILHNRLLYRVALLYSPFCLLKEKLFIKSQSYHWHTKSLQCVSFCSVVPS